MRPALRIEPLSVADPLALPSLEHELQHRWFVWDAWVSGKRRVDIHPLVLSSEAHAEAVSVAERAWSLVETAAERAANDPSERARYRLHPDVERLAAAARAGGDRGCVARVDLLLRDDGRFVACEVNADCPGGFNETLALPRLARAAGARHHTDPTFVASLLADRLVAQSGGAGSPRGIIALAYATAYAEDLQVCALLERMIVERGGRPARMAPTALSEHDGYLAYRGARVSVLYRFYPLEWMAEQANVDAIARAVERGELACMSSFGWIYAQSKLAMARAFAHDESSARDVFPYTAVFSDNLEREHWVVKRDLSRVGDHVYVGALATPEEFRDILADVAEVADEQVWIAQRFVPQRALATPWGPRLLTLGVYVVDGTFAGYFARLSPTSHCSHDALVLPVFREAA